MRHCGGEVEIAILVGMLRHNLSQECFDAFERLHGIGWRRFLEGMVSTKLIKLQSESAMIQGMKLTLERWSRGLITKLLEVAHGQWIYRNLLVHDRISGVLATMKKEELQKEIQRQQELGEDGLDKEDKFLLEIKLEDLEESSGEHQEYWLLAIKAA